jgi:hypothetical protein
VSRSLPFFLCKHDGFLNQLPFYYFYLFRSCCRGFYFYSIWASEFIEVPSLAIQHKNQQFLYDAMEIEPVDLENFDFLKFSFSSFFVMCLFNLFSNLSFYFADGYDFDEILYKPNFLQQVQSTNKECFYTNVYPFVLLPLPSKQMLLLKTVESRQGRQFTFIRQYFGGFLEAFLKAKVFLKLQPFIVFSKEVMQLLTMFLFKYKIFQKIIGIGFFFDEMLFLLWRSLVEKDPRIFVTWLGRTITRLPISKHKRLIKLFHYFLMFYSDFFLDFHKLLGVKFDIRGKVGVTGDSKKRHYLFALGETGFTKKKNRLEYTQGLAYTNTGVLGITLIYVF